MYLIHKRILLRRYGSRALLQRIVFLLVESLYDPFLLVVSYLLSCYVVRLSRPTDIQPHLGLVSCVISDTQRRFPTLLLSHTQSILHSPYILRLLVKLLFRIFCQSFLLTFLILSIKSFLTSYIIIITGGSDKQGGYWLVLLNYFCD